MKKNIKNKIRFFLSSFFFLTGIPFLRFKYLKRKNNEGIVRVLVFHNIENDQKEKFKEKISFLKKRFNIITPQQFDKWEISSEKLNILLTFDDGYKNWKRNVIPILNEYNLSAIFFICSGFINKENIEKIRKEEFWEQNSLSWKEVKKIKENDKTIGGHTFSHPNLASLSSDKIKRELFKDKKKIEKEIDKQLTFFAYPFGGKKKINKEVVDKVRKVGYKKAFSTELGFNSKKTDNFLIKRTTVSPDVSLFSFKSWIYGSYDLFFILKEKIIFTLLGEHFWNKIFRVYNG